MHKQPTALLGTLVGGTLLLLATLSGASEALAQQHAGPSKPPMAATDPKEHWLTIVVDQTDMHLGGSNKFSTSSSFVESDLRSLASVSNVMLCSAWMFWFPVYAPTTWSEIDATATTFALVKRGQDGVIDATPLNLASAASNVRRWYWGPDRKGPDGASEWRMLVYGPPCDCCDPKCPPPENPEVGQQSLGIELHARSYQPSLNWPAAAALPWSEPEEKHAAFLKPAPYVESDSPAVQAFVRNLVGGAPRSKSPFVTALTIARAAAAHAAPEYASQSPPVAIRGLRVAGASAFASSGAGNVHDAHCLSVAAMRAVGIPARVVLGFEIHRNLGGLTQEVELTTWGEFWLGTAGWVPFDCAEMRTDSAGNPAPTAKIDGFGAPSNHNMRVAWSWYLDAPFPRACPREFPAGFAMGPVYSDKDLLDADLSKAYPDAKTRDAMMAVQSKRAQEIGALGTIGATARSSRVARAMWPGYAVKSN